MRRLLATALALIVASTGCGGHEKDASGARETATPSHTASPAPPRGSTPPPSKTPMQTIVPDSPSHLLRATHVLVVRFDAVSPGAWGPGPQGLEARTLNVDVTLVEIAKGTVKEAPGAAFQTALTQHRTPTGRIARMPGAWSDLELDAGAQLVVISMTGSDEAATVMGDPACRLALPSAEALADVHFAKDVEANALDVSGAVALAKSLAPALGFLAGDYLWWRYSAVALADPHKLAPIADLLEEPGLGRGARGTLVTRLTAGLTTPEPPPEKQLDRYAVSLFRLLAMPEAAELHDNIVGTYLPATLGLTGDGARPAAKVFADYPGEPAKALQAVTAYSGSQPKGPLVSWLSR